MKWSYSQMRSAVGRNSSSSPPVIITRRTSVNTASAVVCFIAQKSSSSCSISAAYRSYVSVHSSRCSESTSASSNGRAFAARNSWIALRNLAADT